MGYKHNMQPGRLTLLLLAALTGATTGFGASFAVDQAITAMADRMAASSAPWPRDWCIEYVDTIRDAATVDNEPSDYAQRLNALRDGFPLYWEGVPKDRDRALFELQCAEIRWYVKHLVTSPFPDADDRSTIREQVKDLWHDAADSLIVQFPFLDPNRVCQAQRDHLHECLRWVDTPLKPIFQQPFTRDQMDLIREGWQELRYARVDLMRQLGGEDVFLTPGPAEAAPSAHPDYLLAYRSQEQLEGHIWTLVARPPEDYIKARQNYWKARQQQRQRILLSPGQEDASQNGAIQATLSDRILELPAGRRLGVGPADGPSPGWGAVTWLWRARRRGATEGGDAYAIGYAYAARCATMDLLGASAVMQTNAHEKEFMP